MKRYALITGASAGIGKEFAHQLAESGWNLLLIARREESLQNLSNELTSKYSIDAQYLVADLANSNQPQIIFNHCKNNKINIAMLVNNAVVHKNRQ